MNFDNLKYRTIQEREYKHAPSIKTTPEEYCNIFDELFASGEPILNRYDKELIFAEDEEVRQCYLKGDPIRCELPYSWFLSSKGRLISVIGTKNPKLFWITPDCNNYERLVFKFAIFPNGTRKTRQIKMYNLIGLVYGSEKIGLADALLKIYGLNAFKYRLVEGHHVRNKDVNEPNKIQFFTGLGLRQMFDKLGTHDALRILNKSNPTTEEIKTAMHAISAEISGGYIALLRESYDKNGIQKDGDTCIKPLKFKNDMDYWLNMGKIYDHISDQLTNGTMVAFSAEQDPSAD